MKIYIVKDGWYEKSSAGDFVYFETEICDRCQQWYWKEAEEVAIAKSIELIRGLLIAIRSETGDRFDEEGLNSLYPIRQPFEYDSNHIRLLQGVMQNVAFLGVTDIDMKALESAHRKIFWFGDHVCFNHSYGDEGGNIPVRFFEPEYPTNCDPSSLLLTYYLPDIQNKKTCKETIKYSQQAWRDKEEEWDSNAHKALGIE